MEKEEAVAVFGIVDKLSTRYGNTLTGRFIYGDRLAVTAFRPITASTRDEPTEYAGQDPVLMHFLQPEFIYDEPILRSLLAEANANFVSLQRLQCKGTKNEYTKISRTYRSIVRACLEKLQEAVTTQNAEKESEKSNIASNSKDDVDNKNINGMDSDKNVEENTTEEEKLKYNHYISIFYSIECIWHLSEILYLDPSPMNLVVMQLLEWVRFHFPATERMATDLLLMGRNASDSEEYWPALKGLIMQGQVEVARALLNLHPETESPAYQLTDQILKSVPTFNFLGGLSLQKFRSQWQYWLTDTERKLSTNILSIEPALEELVHLVSGKTEIWDEHIQNSEYWYELLPGYLYYTNPACKHFELGTAANSWLDRWASLRRSFCGGCEPQLKHLDKVILNLMENDIHQVLHAIQLMADNQWFVTHLTDLFYNSGQLQIMGEQQVDHSFKLRNSLLYEFGSLLMTRHSLWYLGMDYLEQSGDEGLPTIELLLTKLSLNTEKQALKILNVCHKKGFTNAHQQICIVQARQSFTESRYGNALEWAIRSKNAVYVSAIADYILKHYTQTGDILCPDVVANVGAKMFLSPRLVFLVKYYDFYQFYRRRDFLPAAELLVNLLESKITPEYFWPSLLIDTIPLLESKDPKILSKETCIILHHLESDLMPLVQKKKKLLDTNPEEPINIIKDYRIENIEEMIGLLRLACARNLARAIIIENSNRS